MRMHLIAASVALALLAGCADTENPHFVSVTALTNTTSTIGPYEVVAVIVDDSPLDIVQLRYQLGDAEDLFVIDMESLGGHAFGGAIPGQPLGTVIHYQVAAKDLAGNEFPYPPPTTGEDGNTTFPVLTFEVVAP